MRALVAAAALLLTAPAWAALVWAAPAWATEPEAAGACGGEVPCRVVLGEYHVVPPPGWDGASPLPMALYFHGYNSSAQGVLKNKPLLAAFAERGLLLVIPQGVPSSEGRPRSWAHGGSPSSARDELAFVDAVIADVEARWPVSARYATGFSQGGSMVWDLACYRGSRFEALTPFAGAFWEPEPERCPDPARRLRHVHGTGDTVVPLAGRPIGGGRWHQGDVPLSLGTLAESDACTAGPTPLGPPAESNEKLRCEAWSGCGGDGEIRLCLHEGGHSMPAEWLGESLDWAVGG